MSRSLRTFLAIDPGPEIRHAISGDVRAVRERLPGWRWIPVENVHLTLRFLGSTDPDRLPGMTERLRRVARAHAPLRLELSPSWGVFPGARRPRILWRPLVGEVERLARLAEGCEHWARAEGYEEEDRPFRPHLTVARARRVERPRAVELEGLRGTGGAFVDVDEFSLFESELRPEGARYIVHGAFRLGESPGREDRP